MNRIAIIAAAALSASFMTAVPAAAKDVSVVVHYADLDTATPTGVKVLGERVKNSVDLACERPESRDLKSNLAWQECREAAFAQAAAQLARQGMPGVTLG